MRTRQERNVDKLHANQNPEYLRGYRDGIRERRSVARSSSGDGLLGALLAIALISAVGYLGYNYANTGQLLPEELNLNVPAPGSVAPQPSPNQ